MHDLRGKVAVVTGAASGIGLAMAARFAAEGMRVVVADVEAAALEVAAGKLEAGGAEVGAVVTDVSDPDAVDALARAALDRFGRVHVVCNNAGVVTMKPLWRQSIEDWRWVLGVDLWGVIHGVRSFVPILLEQGEPAHVVNTASIAGLLASPGIGPYNVAKYGVVALSETLHHDLAEAGADIGVSVLCPGVVPTRISESGRNRPGGREPPIDVPTQHDLPPTARTPEQVAAAVVDAIEERRFWILTHPEFGGPLRDRTERILAGADPAIPPVL